MSDQGSAVVVGVGPGLGAALGRRFAQSNYNVALASRNHNKLVAIVEEIAESGGNARSFCADATDELAVINLMDIVENDLGPLKIAVSNASGRVKKSILDIESNDFENAWRSTCLGGFLVGREAARRMIRRGEGTILFTGATASVKSYGHSAGFAVGKYGLRALAESMARELAPKGIHVGHVVIDGGIGKDSADALLDPDAIAESYYQLHLQPRSAWTWEIEIRPWVEKY